MNKRIIGMVIALLAFIVGLGVAMPIGVYAEDNKPESSENSSEKSSVPGTNISLTPVSKILQISSNSVYEDSFTVTNDGDALMEIEVYSAPYSYVYSSENDSYQLGFNNNTNFTQMSRWITFKNTGGVFEKKTNYSINPHDSLNIDYKISTPDNIPSGGQYAVIFAHTLTGTVSANGIKTAASPGIVVYGRSTEGEAIIKADVSDMKIVHGPSDSDSNKSSTSVYASAKVKNSGNIDFNANGKLKIDPIIGFSSYETPSSGSVISVIPESELTVSDEWKDAPGFGLYKATWTVTIGEDVNTIEQMIFINPFLFIIVVIMVLTLIIVCVIMVIKKRKARRSRLAI